MKPEILTADIKSTFLFASLICRCNTIYILTSILLRLMMIIGIHLRILLHISLSDKPSKTTVQF